MRKILIFLTLFQVRKTFIFLTLFQMRKTLIFRFWVIMRLFDQGCWGGCGQRPRDPTLPGFPQVTFLFQNCQKKKFQNSNLIVRFFVCPTASGSLYSIGFHPNRFEHQFFFFQKCHHLFQKCCQLFLKVHLAPKNFHKFFLKKITFKVPDRPEHRLC